VPAPDRGSWDRRAWGKELLLVLEDSAKRKVGVEYSQSMLEPARPGVLLPDWALCLPTFSHFVIVNKTSLSPSPSLSPPPPPCSLLCFE
jgi:hypothetical protein